MEGKGEGMAPFGPIASNRVPNVVGRRLVKAGGDEDVVAGEGGGKEEEGKGGGVAMPIPSPKEKARTHGDCPPGRRPIRNR